MRAFRSGAQRLRLYKQLPPKRCRARSSRTGLPCRKWSELGTVVCGSHGAKAPQTRAKAAERIAWAEELANGTRRPLWEVLLDAVHVSDVLARREIAELRLAPEVTAEQVDRLVSAIERSGRLSRSGIDAGVDERRVRLAEAQAQQMHGFVLRVLAGLNLTAEQKALVPGLVRREVEGVLAIEGQVTEAAPAVVRPVRRPAVPAPRQPASVESLVVRVPGVFAERPGAVPSSATEAPDPPPEPIVATPPVGSNGHRADKPVVVSRHRDPQSELGPSGDRGWA